MFLGKHITKKYKIKKINGSLFIILLRKAHQVASVWQTPLCTLEVLRTVGKGMVSRIRNQCHCSAN